GGRGGLGGGGASRGEERERRVLQGGRRELEQEERPAGRSGVGGAAGLGDARCVAQPLGPVGEDVAGGQRQRVEPVALVVLDRELRERRAEAVLVVADLDEDAVERKPGGRLGAA